MTSLEIPAKLASRQLVQTITLPSRGLPYGDKVPDGRIWISAITTRDEKAFTSTTSSNEDRLDSLFAAVTELGVPSPELTIGDRFWLLVTLRCLSYGNRYGFQFRCSDCGDQKRHEINLASDMPLVLAPDGWVEPFFATLPMVKKKVGLRLLRGQDEKDVARTAKKMGDKVSPLTLAMAHSIVSVDDVSVREPATWELVDNLVGMDANAIREALEANSHGYNATLVIPCGCGFVNQIRLPLNEEFFRPRAA